MLSGSSSERKRRRPKSSAPTKGWLMVNPTRFPIKITARLVARPNAVVFVPLHLCLSALSKGMVFADKAKKRR